MRACCQCRGGGLHPWRRRSPRAAEQLTPRHNHLKPAHPGLCSAREAPGLHQQRKLAKARKTQQQPKTTKFKKRKTDIVKQLHSNKNLKINTTAPQKSQFSKTLSNESYRHPHTHTHTHTRAKHSYKQSTPHKIPRLSQASQRIPGLANSKTDASPSPAGTVLAPRGPASCRHGCPRWPEAAPAGSPAVRGPSGSVGSPRPLLNALFLGSFSHSSG